MFLDHSVAFFSVLCRVSDDPACQPASTHQCQLLTFVPSERSSTIHRGSPSPHFAICEDVNEGALQLPRVHNLESKKMLENYQLSRFIQQHKIIAADKWLALPRQFIVLPGGESQTMLHPPTQTTSQPPEAGRLCRQAQFRFYSGWRSWQASTSQHAAPPSRRAASPPARGSIAHWQR